MSDLETRLRAALSAGTSSPPPTVGLAAAARQRLRRRRRTRGVVGGVLAVLLVGVPVGVVARDGSGQGDPSDVVRPVEPVGPSDADGWRTETGGDLAVEVPADWLTGDTCGNTGAPVVTVAEEWGCAVTGYGVRFAPYPALGTLATTAEMQRAEGPSWPAGSWWANVQVPGSTYVASVVTADRATGQRILDSARRGPALDEWRTESWNGLSVEVPASWEQGDRRVWCTRGAATRGAVEWPGTLDKQPRCGRPQYGFGVTFGPAGAFDPVYESGRVWQYERGDVEMYVDGSWLGFWYDEDRLVQVNAGDRETVQRILDSLQVQPGRQ